MVPASSRALFLSAAPFPPFITRFKGISWVAEPEDRKVTNILSLFLKKRRTAHVSQNSRQSFSVMTFYSQLENINLSALSIVNVDDESNSEEISGLTYWADKHVLLWASYLMRLQFYF